ncbi:transcriptional regulator GcvA [Rhodovibrionaceae bacterium A322]
MTQPQFPPMNALRVFAVAARHLSFRSAADELGVTQGAVAQQVRGLESALGCKLFDRLPRKLVLTEAGRRYLPPIEEALSLILTATQELRPQQITLSISVTPTFATRWLVPRLAAFTHDNPDMDVRISAAEEQANFQDDGVDLAVREGTAPFGPGLSHERLYPLEIFAVCSPDLCGADRALRPEELTQATLLHDAHGYWPLFLRHLLGKNAAAPTRSLKFNQTAHAIDAALAGQGIALTNQALVADDLAKGRLVPPFRTSLKLASGYYVVCPRKPRQPEAVGRIRQWLLEQAQKDSLSASNSKKD